MWWWVISAISGSILGSATDSWFSETKLGIWFYKKVDDVYTWTAKKLHIKILNEEDKWRKKYPRISKQFDDYDVTIANGISHFKNKELDLEYWIALEASSDYGE